MKAPLFRSRRALRATLAVTAALAGGFALSPTPAYAGSNVLILSSTVTGGASSLEYTTAAGLLGSVDLVAPGSWAPPPQPYSAYKVIVLGDPTCNGSAGAGGPIGAAEANASAWAAAVTGNVVVIGTDPSLHYSWGSLGTAQLWKSAIQFAAAGSGTGAVVDLSCYYYGAAAGTVVNVLSGFGSFKTQGASGDSVSIVATHPALSGLTDADLSNWGDSVHEGFTSWPSTFMPLAVATDSSVPHTFTALDGTRGFPYILARGVTPLEGGILKVCKVAGLGVAVGTPFHFTAGGSSFTVPAGPAPGGTCVVGPTVHVGSTVTVTEAIPAGHVVSAIDVAPPGRLVGTPNLAGGSVDVAIGSGVTEVTYTDKRTGFLEICKRGHLTGNFTFYVNPGGLGPFTVPAGGCSPAIEVPAGSVVIHEMPVHHTVMVGCATLPAGQQGPCNPGLQTSTVDVAPGDVSNQTIAFIDNRPIIPPPVGAGMQHP